MALELASKIDKRKKTYVMASNDDVMLKNCDIRVILPIYGPFGAIPKPGFGCTV